MLLPEFLIVFLVLLIAVVVMLRFLPGRSVLFVVPNYHTTFLLRDELRRGGWRSDVYVPYWYPAKLLYQNDGIVFIKPASRLVLYLKNLIWLFVFFLRYKYFVVYSATTIMPLPSAWLQKIMGEGFQLDLALARLMGKKLIYDPSGCNDTETKENFSKLDRGFVCGNCGWSHEACHDDKNRRKFAVIRRYFHLKLGHSGFQGTQYDSVSLRYKSFDLDLWSPDLVTPQKYLLPPTNNLRIMHSFFKTDREHGGKNIKGSPYILAAIERLKTEGHPVEYFYITDISVHEMRYYQAQADIIVEQLIYGWWGSTGAESMCLGKPTVCYLRPSWKDEFMRDYPEFAVGPVVEADTQNIYQVLKKLVEDRVYRDEMGKRARTFAEQHFDVKKNVQELLCSITRI